MRDVAEGDQVVLAFARCASQAIASGIQRGGVASLRKPSAGRKLAAMATPLFDFSHLSPAERIELAEQLWDSLTEEAVGPTDAQVTELRRRRAELTADGDPGEPWEAVLDEIEERGA